MTFFKRFLNFVVNIFAVCRSSKFEIRGLHVGGGAAVTKIHSRYNKQILGFLSYASFHFSYSTEIFLYFM